jgi:two-component system sensor histidine kinase BaeS
METFEAAARERGVALILDAPEPVAVRGDAGELEMIAGNLLSNAIKYNRDGGSVRVSLHADGARAMLAVADTGIGLSAENVARLFGEFVRIRTAETAHIDGSGLGLSIVRKLVELQGGAISVTSEPGRGTTFTVELDAAVPAKTAERVS